MVNIFATPLYFGNYTEVYFTKSQEHLDCPSKKD